MIEINNLTDFTADEKFLKKSAQTVLKGEGKEKHTLSIALIKEKEIRGLNKKYLKKDKPTDVLSFSLSERTTRVLDESKASSRPRVLDEAKASSRPSLSLRESLLLEEDKSFSSPFADRASERSEGGNERSSLTDARVLDESKASSRPSLSLRERLVGEVIICPQVVKRNAENFNVPFEKELARVLIHGILHLLGYEHEKSDKKRKEMQEKENYYLSLCFS